MKKKFRWTIRNRMLFAFIAFIIFALVFYLIFEERRTKLGKQNNIFSKVIIPSYDYLKEYYNLINYSVLITKNIVAYTEINKDVSNNKELLYLSKLNNDVIPSVEDTLVKLSNSWNDTLHGKLVSIINITHKLLQKESNIISKIGNSPDSTLLADLKNQIFDNEDIDIIANNTLRKINAIKTVFVKQRANGVKTITGVIAGTKKIIVILIIFVLFAVLVTSYYTYRSIIVPIKRLSAIIEDMSVGRYPDKNVKAPNDEVGDMIIALNKLVINLKQTAKFAIAVGEKDFDRIDFKPLSEEDELGKAIVRMKENLKKAEEEEMLRKEEEKQRRWISEGLAKFAELLRQNNDDLVKLADNIVFELVHYVGAEMGALYLYKDDDKENPVLELISAYAYDRKKYINKTIILGEGLVGTCALEKEKIYLTDIPEDYVNIQSGLGEAKPRSVLLVPLKLNEEIYGVMELASFEELPWYKIEFIEKVSESIAATLYAVNMNEKTKTLLEQSQQLTEELTTQGEEMRQNMEELEATQEEMEHQKTEMERILKAIRKAVLYAEFDNNGILRNVSKRLISLLGLKDDNVISYSLKDFVDEDYFEILERVQMGNVVEKEITINDIDFVYTFSPVMDDNGELKKIIAIAERKS